ncbi:unnamed protein product [Linum tenue]|uniref:Uncharacterized protein n=1 Tax=Linum tenue TaxID=586396 RepID=A0AAV0QHT9_9ROSI|nr:unnamed protein product [Linum tenue]
MVVVQWFFCPSLKLPLSIHLPLCRRPKLRQNQTITLPSAAPLLRRSAALAVAAQAPLSIFPLPAHLVAFIGGTSAKTSLLVIALPEG